MKPSDRSMPPEMMTKVWPIASSSGATAKIAIDCRLKVLRMKVPPKAARAQTSKTTISAARNSQARRSAMRWTMRLGALGVVGLRRWRGRRRFGVWCGCHGTFPWRRGSRPPRAGSASRRGALRRGRRAPARLSRCRGTWRRSGRRRWPCHHREAGADRGRDRMAGQVGVGGHDAEIADLGRVLGDRQVDEAGVEVVDDRGRRVEGDDLDLAGLAGLLDAVAGAEGREQVGAEDAGEVRVAGEDGLELARPPCWRRRR